mmetsp:Transcript_32079/g.65332  ORF Transcript_32079/g.65332 Transcript_32079/m.65332 type:complete len:1912 (-) Transcript_32079:226-5961(-)
MALNSTNIVLTSLEGSCTKLPEWMTDDVYLSPESTLLVAIFAVALYAIFTPNNLQRPLMIATVTDAFAKIRGSKISSNDDEDVKAAKVRAALEAFQRLPEKTQILADLALREQMHSALPGVRMMPDIGDPPSKRVSKWLTVHKEEAAEAMSRTKTNKSSPVSTAETDSGGSSPADMVASDSPAATMMLNFLDSTIWVLTIMTIVILQLIVSGKKLLPSSSEQVLDLCIIVFFAGEVLLRLGLFRASGFGASTFFYGTISTKWFENVKWFNCLDAFVVFVDLMLLLIGSLVGSSGSPRASSARLARFGKVIGKLFKMGKFRRLLLGARLFKPAAGDSFEDADNGITFKPEKGRLRVTNIVSDKPAASAGIKIGWNCLKVGDQDVQSEVEYWSAHRKLSVRRRPSSFFLDRTDDVLASCYFTFERSILDRTSGPQKSSETTAAEDKMSMHSIEKSEKIDLKLGERQEDIQQGKVRRKPKAPKRMMSMDKSPSAATKDSSNLGPAKEMQEQFPPNPETDQLLKKASEEWRTWVKNIEVSRFDDLPFAKDYTDILQKAEMSDKSWQNIDSNFKKAFKEDPTLPQASPASRGAQVGSNGKSGAKADVDDIFSDLASVEWCQWYNELSLPQQELIFPIVMSMDATRKETYEASNREDTTVFFVLQVLVVIGIMADYFLNQERPSGESWECVWTYNIAIYMYKPFAVPMWFCLMLCCHYSFAEQVYGKGGGRDSYTGTPLHAPLQRDKLSLAMFSFVALFQVSWCLAALGFTFPLLIIFSPVIILVAFLFPLAFITVVQKTVSYVETKWRLYLLSGGVLEALRRDGMELKELKNSLFGYLLLKREFENSDNERKLCLAAVKQNGKALEYVSEHLKKDRGLILAAVKQSGMCLEYAMLGKEASPEDSETRFDIVLAAVQEDGLALQHAPDEMKDISRLVLKAVEQNGFALEFASKSLKESQEVVTAAVKEEGRALKFASDKMQDNLQVVLTALSENGLALEFVSNEMMDMKKVVMTALIQEGEALKFANAHWKNDEDVVKLAVAQDADAILFASERLQISWVRPGGKEHLTSRDGEGDGPVLPNNFAGAVLHGFESNFWILVIMTIVILQNFATEDAWFEDKTPMDITVVALFTAEIVLRIEFTRQVNPTSGIASFFFQTSFSSACNQVQWFNVLDFVVWLVDIVLLGITVTGPTGGNSGNASSARVVRFGKVLGKFSKSNKYARILLQYFKLSTAKAKVRDSTEWNDKFKVELSKQKKDLFESKVLIDAFRKMDNDSTGSRGSTGSLKIETLSSFFKQTDNRVPSNSHRYLRRRSSQSVIEGMDKDSSGDIDIGEWAASILNMNKDDKGLLFDLCKRKLDKEKMEEAKEPRIKDNFKDEKVEPLSFYQAIIVLKANATQLMSVNILLFYFLPFYREGFHWWDSGANSFSQGTGLTELLVDPTSYVTNLILKFQFDLSWPSFPQFKLQLQLAVGASLIFLQLVFRFWKGISRNCYTSLRMEAPQPGLWERRLVSWLAWCSWAPYGWAMDVSKAAFIQAYNTSLDESNEAYPKGPLPSTTKKKQIEGNNTKVTNEESEGSIEAATIVEGKAAQDLSSEESWGKTMKAKVDWLDLVLTNFVGMATLVLPMFYARTEARTIVFHVEDGDDAVEKFCTSETSMSFVRIKFAHTLIHGGTDVPEDLEAVGNERITSESLKFISHRCLWITHLDLSFCGIRNDLGDVGRLGMLENLKVLLCKRCKRLSGDLGGLSKLLLLEDLDLSATRVRGDVKNLAINSKLKKIYLADTNVDGEVWSLSCLINLKMLNLDRTNVNHLEVETFEKMLNRLEIEASDDLPPGAAPGGKGTGDGPEQDEPKPKAEVAADGLLTVLTTEMARPSEKMGEETAESHLSSSESLDSCSSSVELLSQLESGRQTPDAAFV